MIHWHENIIGHYYSYDLLSSYNFQGVQLVQEQSRVGHNLRRKWVMVLLLEQIFSRRLQGAFPYPNSKV